MTEPLQEFADIMRQLRAECEWKSTQTHRSLTRYLLEESYETIDAIEGGTDDELCEELGDLLLQVYFHAVIAEQRGAFTLDDVARGISDKMQRRNPHVFPDASRASVGPSGSGGSVYEINETWEAIKATEKRRGSVMEGVPDTLPALLYADKAIDRHQRAGSWRAAAPESGDLGERLLALVQEAHAAGVDPEQALRDAVRSRRTSDVNE